MNQTAPGPKSSGGRSGGRNRSRGGRDRNRRRNRKRGPRKEARTPLGVQDFSFLIPERKEGQKFFTEENLHDEAFGFQSPTSDEALEYQQIYRIIHGQQGAVEIPEDKDDYAGVRGDIVYYCKDCEKLVEPKKHPKRQYLFMCSVCNGENVSWGTEQGIKSHFHIRSADAPKPVKRDPGN